MSNLPPGVSNAMIERMTGWDQQWSKDEWDAFDQNILEHFLGITNSQFKRLAPVLRECLIEIAAYMDEWEFNEL
jgi:uncharacterized tellurite resistance protein B-like protein